MPQQVTIVRLTDAEAEVTDSAGNSEIASKAAAHFKRELLANSTIIRGLRKKGSLGRADLELAQSAVQANRELLQSVPDSSERTQLLEGLDQTAAIIAEGLTMQVSERVGAGVDGEW